MYQILEANKEPATRDLPFKERFLDFRKEIFFFKESIRMVHVDGNMFMLTSKWNPRIVTLSPCVTCLYLERVGTDGSMSLAIWLRGIRKDFCRLALELDDVS